MMAKKEKQMAKYPVIKVFRDKINQERYTVGQIYETEDEERAAYLQRSGFLGEEIQNEPPIASGNGEGDGQ